MSLGWGKVSQAEWDAAKAATIGSDEVPDGDYVVEVQQLRHIEPKDAKLGAYILSTLTTSGANMAALVGKKLEARFQYDPNPATDGRRTMNAISLQNAITFIEAARVEPITDAMGNLDIPGTLGSLAALKSQLVVNVSHRKGDDGKTYVEVAKPRPLG